uniref:Uncharacterized protein n=1 Tax=Tanacetum cinerariifolium TaxID=118510 RepID=A0A6L2NDH5_TANCI|nr:hypothetical protein [Tanacetum cinerariifolium]
MSHTNLSQQQSGSYQQASQETQEEEDETEPVPTSTSKKPSSRGKRVKSMAKKTVQPEPQAETVRVRNFWSQEEELLLADCFIQYPRIQELGRIKRMIRFGKRKWNNPESTQARRNRHRVTDPEPELFGYDALRRPPGMHRIVKSQRSSNSSANFGSNPAMF